MNKRFMSRHLDISAHRSEVTHDSSDAKLCAILKKKVSTLIEDHEIVEITFIVKVDDERNVTT